jgi:hypothetical protein
MYFSRNYSRTLLHDPILSSSSVDPTSQVRSTAMLVLPNVGNSKLLFLVDFSCIMFIPNFIKLCLAVLELNHSDGQRDRQTRSAQYAFMLRIGLS